MGIMSDGVAKHIGAHDVVITDASAACLKLVAATADVVPVDIRATNLRAEPTGDG